jgi:hypothetical protein
MYEPVQTLAEIDRHQWQIIAACGLAMICNYAWFFAAFRQGNRDRTYSVPVACSLFWLVGDATVVLNFDRAFNTFDHWYPKLFWVALLFTVAFEIAFLAQTVRYGHRELLPAWSKGQFIALIVGGVVTVAALWATVQSSFEDDLFIVYFHLANVMMPLFYVGILIRRRSSAGTNRFIWIAYLAMESIWYFATFVWFGDDLQRWETVALWIVTSAGCLAMIWVIGRLPRTTPEPPAPAETGPRERSLTAAGVGVARQAHG